MPVQFNATLGDPKGTCVLTKEFPIGPACPKADQRVFLDGVGVILQEVKRLIKLRKKEHNSENGEQVKKRKMRQEVQQQLSQPPRQRQREQEQEKELDEREGRKVERKLDKGRRHRTKRTSGNEKMHVETAVLTDNDDDGT